jgi:aspartate carbamoyltransferase regulatory subunit
MSIFEDKKYSEMDWLSQAVEPIVSALNDELQQLPKTFTLTYDDIARLYSRGYSNSEIYIKDMLSHCLSKVGLKQKDVDQRLLKCYNIACVGSPTIDFSSGKLDGEITLYRNKDHFEEKELLTFMGQIGLQFLNAVDASKVSVERANEILELLGDKDLLKSKSVSVKVQGINSIYAKAMKDNIWNIRNIELSDKVGTWIALFLTDGNMPALINFCKFKVMTHNNQPIYSIQEELV